MGHIKNRLTKTWVCYDWLSYDDIVSLTASGFEFDCYIDTEQVHASHGTYDIVTKKSVRVITKSPEEETMLLLKFPTQFDLICATR